MVKGSLSGNNFPRSSVASFMDLNLMILNILSFLPGRSWKKKGLPLLANHGRMVMIKKRGEITNSPIADSVISRKRLKKERYICLVHIQFLLYLI